MLKTRIVTAVIALLLLGAVLFVVPPPIAKLVIAGLVLAGSWEWSGFLGVSTTTARSIFVLLIAILLAFYLLSAPAYSTSILYVACIWWFVAFMWIFFFPTPISRFLRWICGILVLLPMYVALVGLYDLAPQFLLFALLIVWAADIGAYFAGKQFGRVKLAPNISPGKTWEGLFGGLFLVLALALVWGSYQGAPLAVLVPFCLAVAVLSVVGDLTVSMFKRTSGVKDSGKLFPGHGGVLDRVDSVAAATPLFALGFSWLGLAA